MIKIEHLGIAVKDAAKAKEVFRKLLGADAYKEEAVASEVGQYHLLSIGRK